MLSAPTAPDLAFRIVDPMPVKAVSRLKMVCLPRRKRWGRHVRSRLSMVLRPHFCFGSAFDPDHPFRRPASREAWADWPEGPWSEDLRPKSALCLTPPACAIRFRSSGPSNTAPKSRAR